MEKTCPYNCNNGRIFDHKLHNFVPCPHCSGILSELTATRVDNTSETAPEINLLDKLCVPEYYREASFKPNEFFGAESKTTFAESTFQPVLEQLIAIEDAINRSKVVCQSFYFYVGVPAENSTLQYVYCQLISAVKHGITTVPYASLKDLQAIRQQTAQASKLYENLTWLDFTSCDICFVCCTADADEEEFAILADLLQERSRRGLPTYVFGYWTKLWLRQHRKTISYLFTDNPRNLGMLTYSGIMSKVAYREEAQKQSTSSGLLNVLNQVNAGGVAPLGIVNNTPSPEVNKSPERGSANLCGISPEKYGYNIGGLQDDK